MKSLQALLFRLLVFVICVLNTPVLKAQDPFFRQVRLPEIINATTLNCIYQDGSGFIWLGSGKGLLRYNGKDFYTIPLAKGNAEIQVTALFMDSTSRLWVGTRKGEIYHLVNDSLVEFQPEEGLPTKAITGFATDQKGNLWFSTYGEGLYYFNERHLYNLNTDDGLSDNFCYGIVPDMYGRIWAATDEGISICLASGKMKKVDKVTVLQGLPDNIVLSISPGMNGHMWIGMQDGGICSVNSYNLKVNIPDVAQNWVYGPVRDILVFNDILWITTDQNGVLEIDPVRQSFPKSFLTGSNMSFPRVSGLMADNQGNCWITTNSELIFSTGPGLKTLKVWNGREIGKVQSILKDRYGRVWFSNEGHLHMIQPGKEGMIQKEIHLPFSVHTHIISLYEDSCGYIWAGTFGNGLLRINPVSGRTRWIREKDGLSNGNILSIAGKGNEIWLATLGGAYRCLLKENPDRDDASLEFTNFDQENGPGNNYIYSVYIDSKRRVWFGTDGKGISVYDHGRFTTFSETNGLKSKVVYSITEDEKGRIWFTTANAGVYCYDGKSFKNISLMDGLSEMQISCIASDRKNHILFANDHGIDILDTRTGSFIYYGSELGLDDINPDLNVISGDGTHTFWLGTQNGMVRLEIPRDGRPRRPSLKLNKVAVFLGNENYIDVHSFSWNQNYLSFFFNAAWFSAPDMVTYQIKLEGYDLEWINTRDNMATYSNLPPGNYTFLIRAGLKNNYKDSVIISYQFEIHKPLWKEIWFIILVILFAGSVILMIIRQREVRYRQKEAQEREKLLFQFQTLRSQVNPHFLFNSFSTLMSVIDEDKEMAIEYVQKLSQFFRNILEYRDKDLISLQEELKLIDTYRYLQQQRYGENFQMEILVKPEEMSSLIPPMTLQMLVENAIKHNVVSPDKPLLVRIYTEENKLIVCNNLQRKKLVESSTGIGLENIRNRYRLLGQEGISLVETIDQFIIELPLLKP
ncbi:MAG: histidine kinase [Bacteroidales bacterium]|nr:histidine kinase [Bacteroidales bacterium]